MQFGDLPPIEQRRRTGPRSWLSETAELRLHPYQWALLCTKDAVGSAQSMVATIRLARTQAFAPPGSFEAKSRGCDVWVRYIGGES